MRRALLVTTLLIAAVLVPDAGAQLLGNSGIPWLARESDGYDRPVSHSRTSTATRFWSRPLADSGNINITQYPFADQTEPAIAIDPTDPKTIIVGANDDRDLQTLWVYTSHDGGQTWLNQPLPKQTFMQYATDPAVAFDRSGAAYFVCGRMDEFGIPFPRNDVVCYRSTDHGDTWSIASSIFADSLTVGGADTLADKYYLAVDNSPLSPHQGRLYVTWVDQGNDDTLTRIVTAFSDDSGYHWTHRRYVTEDRSFYHAPVPAVGREGQLLITYIDLLHKQIDIATSDDFGKSFQNRVLSGYIDVGPVEPVGDNRGYPTIKGNLAINSFPSIAVDTRPNSGGSAYVVWAAQTDDGWPHVFASTGSNGGHDWSPARRIDSDPSLFKNDKFFPWVAVDPVSGHVGIDYYDSRNDPTNRLCDLYLAISSDSGGSFRDTRVTTQSIDPTIGRGRRQVGTWTFTFFGDYIGLAGHDQKWRPVWCGDGAPDDLDIYTAEISEGSNAAPPLTAEQTSVRVGINSLMITTVEQAQVHISIVDVLGREDYGYSERSNGLTTAIRLERPEVSPLFYRIVVSGPRTEVRTGRIR